LFLWGIRMNHLARSFQKHIGQRGCHFYDSDTCNFLTWEEVFKFLRSLPQKNSEDVFSEKLTETLANYDPEREYLAVHQHGESVSVELYAHSRQVYKK
jgi:hypothetical protein